MITIVIIAAVIFIFYLFNSDKNEAIAKNQQIGGLRNRFPNFVSYAQQSHTYHCYPDFIFVKDDGRYLEYKFPIGVAGYYYLGIESVFGTMAYVYAINSNGKKIKGFIREIHNGKNNNFPANKSIVEYENIFSGLISQMEDDFDFDDKFYG